MLESLLTLVIDIILMNPHNLPSNVAQKLTQLLSIKNHNGSNGPTAVELPERAN